MPLANRTNLTSLIGSRRSIGLTAFWTTLPVALLAAFTENSGALASGRMILAYLGIIVLAQAAVGVVLIICRLALSATNPARRSVRAVTVIVTLIAGASRGFLLVTLLPWAGLADTTSAANRIIWSAIIFAVWLTLCGLALEANDQYRQELRTLLEQLVTKELQQRLLDEGRRVTPATNEGDSDYRRTSRMLHDALEARLRLINHDMWFASTPAVAVSQNRLGLLRTVVATPVPQWSVLTFYTVIVILFTCWELGMGTGLVIGLTFSAATAAIVLTISGGWLYGMLLVVPAGIVTLLVTVLPTASLGSGNGAVIVIIGFLTPATTFIGTAVRATIDDRRGVLTELSTRIEAVPWDGIED